MNFANCRAVCPVTYVGQLLSIGCFVKNDESYQEVLDEIKLGKVPSVFELYKQYVITVSKKYDNIINKCCIILNTTLRKNSVF